jgi:3-dehydroquinate dehydratase-2
MKISKKPKWRILVIHGPNLNLLGEREPGIYGDKSLGELNRMIRYRAREAGVKVKIFQSNHEGHIIDFIHRFRRWTDGILINPAALTHTSIALRDALVATAKPVVEVHLSNINERETFRKKSVVAPICIQQISGELHNSYITGMDCIISHLTAKRPSLEL